MDSTQHQGGPYEALHRGGGERTQSTLFPARLDEYITEDNNVRVIDAFVDTLNLKVLGFGGTVPADTGRPAYHPAVMT